MHNFTDTDMTMLHEMGYVACYVEDLEDGDEIAFAFAPLFTTEAPKTIEFQTVTQLKKVPQYQTDWMGRAMNGIPHYLVRWIAIRDDGVTKPMQYGAGWAVYRKRA